MEKNTIPINLDVFTRVDSERMLKCFEPGRDVHCLPFCYLSKPVTIYPTSYLTFPLGWVTDRFSETRLGVISWFSSKCSPPGFSILEYGISFPRHSCHNAIVQNTPPYLIFFSYFVNTASETGFKYSHFSSTLLLSLPIQVFNFPHLHPWNWFCSSHVPLLPPPTHPFPYTRISISQTKGSVFMLCLNSFSNSLSPLKQNGKSTLPADSILCLSPTFSVASLASFYFTF